MKKLFFVAAALAFAALFSCSKKSDSASSSGEITFTFFSCDATEDLPFTDPIAEEIKKRTGVSLEVTHPVAGDAQAIPLMMASGEYPDLIFAKGELSKLIDAGAVIPLDDYIEKYGQNMKKLYGPAIARLRNSLEDPHIYNVGTYGVHNTLYEVVGNMQIQHAVLKELGYPKITTLDQYADAIRSYMKKYPEINGQKTIGFSLLIDTWQWYIDLSNPGNYVIGHHDDGQWIVDQSTLKAQYKFLDPEIYKYYKWLNQMNEEGILDPESFTQKEDVWQAKIAAGRVLGISYPTWGYGTARTSLIGGGNADRTYAPLPVVAGPEYKDPSRKDFGYSGGTYGIAITTACKDPVRAFKFLDWMCSEEAQILVNWGLPGLNYELDENGKRRRLDSDLQMAINDPDYSKKTGVGKWIYPFPQYGNAALDSNGEHFTPNSREEIIKNYLPVEKETLSAYGAEMWIDMFPSEEELGVSKYGQLWQYSLPPEVNEKVTVADEYVKTALAKIVLGAPSSFDAEWKKMQDELKRMGLEQAGEVLTQMIADKIKLWAE